MRKQLFQFLKSNAMKKLTVNEMKKVKGGSKLTHACYYAPAGAFLSELFGNVMTKALSRTFIGICWDN